MTVRISGPMFDGRAMAALDAYTHQLEDEIAKAGKEMVLRRFSTVLQNPTGHYESLIRADRTSQGARIGDGGKSKYGPWLEGTGTRNYPVTVFRGYRTFTLVGQQLRAKSGDIAKFTLPALIARME